MRQFIDTDGRVSYERRIDVDLSVRIAHALDLKLLLGFERSGQGEGERELVALTRGTIGGIHCDIASNGVNG